MSLIKRVIARLFRPLNRYSSRVGASSQLIARLHYLIFSNRFGREQQSFLAGQQAYRVSLSSPTNSMAILRRNVHRLEKGLLMRPRRVPFAVDYIPETTKAYAKAVTAKQSNMDPAELDWANDVLTEYFAVHREEDAVKASRELFEQHRIPTKETAAPTRIPYHRDLNSPPPVAFEAFKNLAHRRRSVRWFLPKKVERHLIDQAIEVGTQAPSACNRQPFEFRIFDDQALVQKLVQIPFGLAGYGHNVPVLIVVTGQQRNYFDERDRHLIYIDASLAVMGFILALETLGLSSCCINWPDIEKKERQMQDLIGLEDDERPIMLLALGYPDPEGMVANSTKKSLTHIRRYNLG